MAERKAARKAAAKTAAKAPARKAAAKTAAKAPARKAPAASAPAAAAAAAPAPAPAARTGGIPPYPQTPVLETPMAAVVLVANILIPGLGTLVGGIIAHQRLIGRAVAQFLLAIIIVGWVWGVITGVQALVNASWGAKSRAGSA
jgi:hypothetical protein